MRQVKPFFSAVQAVAQQNPTPDRVNPPNGFAKIQESDLP